MKTMKPKFQITKKSGARLFAVLAGAALAGSTLAACSNPQSDAPNDSAVPPPMPTENAAPAATDATSHDATSHDEMSHDKASTPKTYRDVGGQIVSINAPEKNVAGSKTTVTLDHEEIPEFMRAMRMTVPLRNPADAKKFKKGDKIRCDFVMENGSLVLANIRVLSADIKLKLAPA